MKNFDEWWKWWESRNFVGYKTKKEIAQIAWHAGQAAITEVKIYEQKTETDSRG